MKREYLSEAIKETTNDLLNFLKAIKQYSISSLESVKKFIKFYLDYPRKLARGEIYGREGATWYALLLGVIEGSVWGTIAFDILSKIRPEITKNPATTVIYTSLILAVLRLLQAKYEKVKMELEGVYK